ncbi:hypothetical protein BDV37DRAFT_249304 [Aspergillus pseudonomiae]|uniref:Uncharacterized protein n=1 Tax=Aspergillus pseudonomiae TaxID=1506151 RepID=A0A5N7DBE2_9EURO|nr:uncharacterized protein BDV37DRAFT_249304 [Aspergillus pseudonomiae]KAE8403786.1 hypothetical protein BDV37DRAFT_249304 [Aspergillus pseudonomiae]
MFAGRATRHAARMHRLFIMAEMSFTRASSAVADMHFNPGLRHTVYGMTDGVGRRALVRIKLCTPLRTATISLSSPRIRKPSSKCLKKITPMRKATC